MIMKGMRETYDAWIREEIDRRQNSKRIAGERVVEYAQVHGWSPEEIRDVLAMLGVTE